ncbi:MAG: ABC transporter substrate-binding protein [Clostridium sp.]|nr:ABC transporter substrate-binding protein [Clostridium sp.]
MKIIRKVSVILICIITVIGMSGCSLNSNAKVNDSKSQKQVQLKGKVNIWASSRDINILNTEVSLFKKEYPNVTVNITPVNTASVKDNLSKISGNANLPDFITLQDIDVPIAYKDLKNKITTVDNLPIKNDSYIKYQENNNTFGNKTYAVPWYVDPLFMIYRQDILNSLNVKAEDIKTWDKYIDIGSNGVKSAGKSMLSVDYFNDGSLYAAGINELGINYFDGNNQLELEDSIKPANLVLNSFNGKILGNDSTSAGRVADFSSGKTVSMLCDLPTIYSIEHQYPNLSGKISVQKLPAFEPGGNRDAVNFGENIMCFKKAASNEAAGVFIKFITSSSDSVKMEFKNYGYITSNTSMYNSNPYFYGNDKFYGNNSIGRIAIDEANGFINVAYNEHFATIRDTLYSNILNSINSNKDLKQTIYEVQNSLQNSNNTK